LGSREANPEKFYARSMGCTSQKRGREGEDFVKKKKERKNRATIRASKPSRVPGGQGLIATWPGRERINRGLRHGAIVKALQSKKDSQERRATGGGGAKRRSVNHITTTEEARAAIGTSKKAKKRRLRKSSSRPFTARPPWHRTWTGTGRCDDVNLRRRESSPITDTPPGVPGLFKEDPAKGDREWSPKIIGRKKCLHHRGKGVHTDSSRDRLGTDWDGGGRSHGGHDTLFQWFEKKQFRKEIV